MALAGTISVFIKGDIQDPVNVIFDPPVTANALADGDRMATIQATNELPDLRLRFLRDFALGSHLNNTL